MEQFDKQKDAQIKLMIERQVAQKLENECLLGQAFLSNKQNFSNDNTKFPPHLVKQSSPKHQDPKRE